MLDIDTALLRTFVILAETRSFTRTAERVHRTQSAISMQIARLEELLGCTLFERNKRNVRLTENGERLHSYASRIVGMSDSLLERFHAGEIEGSINFGSPEDFATFYLPDVLSEFVQSYPSIKLNVNCDLTLTLIKGFNKKQYDLIIIKQEPGKLYPGARTLWREHLVWVGGDGEERDLTFRKIARIHRDRGDSLPLILTPSPCVYRQRAVEAMDKAGVPWQAVYTSPSFAGVTAAVRAGLGYSVFPRNMVPETLFPLEQGRGWPRLKEAEICLLARSPVNPAVESLITHIRKRVSYNAAP